MASEQETHGHPVLGHEVSYKALVTVAVILASLTGLTVYASTIDFGAAAINIIVAMVIATVKTALVAGFFMHLKYEDFLTWVFIMFPILLLGLLIGFSLGDDFLRIIPVVNF